MSIYYCARCCCLRDSDYDLPEVIDGVEICESCQMEMDPALIEWVESQQKSSLDLFIAEHEND